MPNDQVMQEAARLAADGEIGNSDAIRLLQMPHSPDDLREVLRKYASQLTAQARGKLACAAMVPLPDHVENQRFEPIFDRHPISGRTYTTASGTVVLNEVQYFNGKMVQFFGECTNVAPVRDALAGSGYQPLIIRYRDGRETAVAHFWAHNLSDTSLRPYNAIFVILVVVPDGTPAHQAYITGDANGASSLMSVLDGSFDRDSGVYTNRAKLYYVRLLDSTRVAIEVGRERMGTDKRPGTIDMTLAGRQIGFFVRNGAGHGVAKIHATISDDPTACRGDVAQAAATAGITLGSYPPGTEYTYPCVARIGQGPVLPWEWRTDLQPQLQRVQPGMIVFDASSEEGTFMINSGFQPRVLGYLSHVRGVVTGVPEGPTARAPRVRIKDPKAAVTLRPDWR